MSKISIITINYNNFKGLEKTISSVLNQTYKEIEYIIIDGGSTDGSKELIESNGNQLKYWISEPDRGIYNAMNKGIKQSCGDYLLFLNSGDYLKDKFVLERVANELISGISIFSGSTILIDKNNITGKIIPPDEIDFGRLYFFGLPHPSTFFKKELFDKYGNYNEQNQIVSDWEFFFKVLGINDETFKKIPVEVAFFEAGGISGADKSVEIRLKEKQIARDKYLSKTIQLYIEKQENFNEISKFKRYQLLRRIEKSFFLRKFTTGLLTIVALFVRKK